MRLFTLFPALKAETASSARSSLKYATACKLNESMIKCLSWLLAFDRFITD